MSRLLIATLLAGGALSSFAAEGPPAKPTHKFGLVCPIVAIDPASPSAKDGLERCLEGRYGPGVAVHLLSDTDSTTCSVVTGRVGADIMGGECTVLMGFERCEGSYTLGVVGSAGAYRGVEPQAVKDEAILRKLSHAIVKGQVADAASRRWKRELKDLVLDSTILEAVTWPKLQGSPTLVRLKVSGVSNEGPWVAVLRGEAGTIVGPFSMQVPSGFILDGRSYLSIPIAVCTNCGGVGTAVHAVEAGNLRRVFESFARSN